MLFLGVRFLEEFEYVGVLWCHGLHRFVEENSVYEEVLLEYGIGLRVDPEKLAAHLVSQTH